MRLDSARSLKEELLSAVVAPMVAAADRARAAGANAVERAIGPSLRGVFAMSARPLESIPDVQRSVALGVAPNGKGQYRLAIRVQRQALMASDMVEHLVERAKGEADVRMIGRLDKRGARAALAVPVASASAIPWYRKNTRPLLIGASIAHVRVTAGTTGAFVQRGKAVYVLSNNHVLANEDDAKAGDWALQRAPYDGGKDPRERVARLRYWIRFKRNRSNHVDAALARIEPGIAYDANLLRGLVGGANRRLAGLGPELVDAGDIVYKVGRTTGATKGRVTAFDLDNVVVSYDLGNLRFDDQIEIEGTGRRPFSDGGDSGSLIVDGDMRAVGLLFAGGDTGGTNGLGLTYANPIHRVLGDLRCTLLS